MTKLTDVPRDGLSEAKFQNTRIVVKEEFKHWMGDGASVVVGDCDFANGLWWIFLTLENGLVYVSKWCELFYLNGTVYALWEKREEYSEEASAKPILLIQVESFV